MIRMLMAAVVATFCLSSATAPAAAMSNPFSWVEGWYADAFGPDAKPDGTSKVLEAYLVPDLKALWVADRDEAGKRGEVGRISADPLIDAQDFDPAFLKTLKLEGVEGTPLIRATFQLFPEDSGSVRTVYFELAPDGMDWKIANIHYSDGRSLRTLLLLPLE